MIHTQYYALMRGLSDAIQQAAPNTRINQWDYNYAAKTFSTLKHHRNPLPFPKGIFNLTSSRKQFNYSLNQNATVGTNGADLIKYPNAFPVASVTDKFDIYALTNRYEIAINISLHFETASQMLDFYHAYVEYFPSQGKYFYDFEYDYYLYLPKEILDNYDPETDEAINIYAALKDDASDYKLFSKCVATPLLKCESIDMDQDKPGENHKINLNFTVQDSFIYLLMTVDHSYWVRATTLEIITEVTDYNGDTTELEVDGPYIVDENGEPDYSQDKSNDKLMTENNTNETNNDTEIEIVDTGAESSTHDTGAL